MTDLFDKYNKFIKFEINQISERLSKIPDMIGYYQNVFYTIQTKHTKIRFELDKEWQSKFLYYKNDFNFVLSSTEIKAFIEKDLEYIEIKQKLQETTDILNQTEIILKSLDNMRWTIHDLIEWEKFKQGKF